MCAYGDHLWLCLTSIYSSLFFTHSSKAYSFRSYLATWIYELLIFIAFCGSIRRFISWFACQVLNISVVKLRTVHILKPEMLLICKTYELKINDNLSWEKIQELMLIFCCCGGACAFDDWSQVSWPLHHPPINRSYESS